MGGYKGFGLGMLLDMLVGGLSGGFCPPAPPDEFECNNVLMIAFDPARFSGLTHFVSQSQGLGDFVRSAKPIVPDQEIRLLRGPLFVGESYTTEREVVALSGSRRTESMWVRTAVFSADSAPVATMLLNLASIKQSYAPYENVKAQAYPTIMITAGLNDPRVPYWEPAKLTAKLRAMKTDSNTLLLHTNMGAGHMGASGRYDAIKEMALRYAFVLDALGVTAEPPGSVAAPKP